MFFQLMKKERKKKWRRANNTAKKDLHLINAKEKNGNIQIHIKKTKGKYKTVWFDKKFDATTNGTGLLKRILGKNNNFPFPKSLYTVKECLEATCKNNRNAIVLDFFAGSGTTGHAVLELNKEDNGNRQFILCTNNENNICEEITYPRVKNVIKGYQFQEKKRDILEQGLGGNLRYFKADFIDYNAYVTDGLKMKITKNATEILCVKENAFEKIKDNKMFKIFKSNKNYIGILFKDTYLNKFKEEIKKIDKSTSIYVFSLFGEGAFEGQFNHFKNVKIIPVPEAILKVYIKIFFKR